METSLLSGPPHQRAGRNCLGEVEDQLWQLEGDEVVEGKFRGEANWNGEEKRGDSNLTIGRCNWLCFAMEEIGREREVGVPTLGWWSGDDGMDRRGMHGWGRGVDWRLVAASLSVTVVVALFSIWMKGVGKAGVV